MDSVPQRLSVDDPRGVLPLGEHLAASVGRGSGKVVREGRGIEPGTLVECWRWLFGEH